MVNRDKIEEFLLALNAKILFRDIVFRPRDKNIEALADLEITPNQRINFIKNLTIEDCFSGPNPNKDEPSKPDYFEFGLMIKNTEIYIKLSLNLPNKPIDCVSFHKAEKTIYYPFKNK